VKAAIHTGGTPSWYEFLDETGRAAQKSEGLASI
jgi:hypothetical protein